MVRVGPEKVQVVWPHIEDLVLEAVRVCDERTSFEALVGDIMDGTSVLWVVLDDAGHDVFAIIGTKILTYPGGYKACGIEYAVGEQVDEWMRDGLETIEQYARDEGCQRVELLGRKGWQRKLPEYKMNRILLKKDL